MQTHGAHHSISAKGIPISYDHELERIERTGGVEVGR